MPDATNSPMQQAEQAVVDGATETLRTLLETHPELVAEHTTANPVTLLYDVGVNSVVRSYPDAPATAKVLIDAGADILEPLWSAACVGAIPILTVLLDGGAPVDGAGRPWTPMDEALYWGHTAAAQYLRDRGAPIPSLRAAAGLGDAARLTDWFDGETLRAGAGAVRSPFGAEIPSYDSSDPQVLLDHALFFAVMNAQIPAAEFLLDRGADASAVCPGTHHGGRALHCAAGQGSLDMVQLLVERGADPDARDEGGGYLALGWARHHERDAVAAWLEPRTSSKK